MSTNVEVQKSGNETALATIRKFSRRVQGAGLIRAVRNRRYFARDASKIVKKKRALKLLKRRAEYKQLIKDGKIADTRPSRGGTFRTLRESLTREDESPPSTFREGAAATR